MSHGMSGTPIYAVWVNMRQRCCNRRHPNYRRYGARSIGVCQRWHDFAVWYADIIAELGPRPKGMSIDRKDNNGNYEPGNVRWATAKEQRANCRPPTLWFAQPTKHWRPKK